MFLFIDLLPFNLINLLDYELVKFFFKSENIVAYLELIFSSLYFF